MADATLLIPLDRAVACVWPVSADDPRLNLRIVDGQPSETQREWLAKRGGRATILDPTGTGDARAFWIATGRNPGWADATQLHGELGKLDCALGAYMRSIAAALRVPA